MSNGPAAHQRWSQKGIPPGWLRIAADQIEHKLKTVRILKLKYDAGGYCFRVRFKDYRGNWCGIPKLFETLGEAVECGEEFSTQARKKK